MDPVHLHAMGENRHSFASLQPLVGLFLGASAGVHGLGLGGTALCPGPKPSPFPWGVHGMGLGGTALCPGPKPSPFPGGGAWDWVRGGTALCPGPKPSPVS